MLILIHGSQTHWWVRGGWHLRIYKAIKAHDIRFIMCWSLARYYTPLWPIQSTFLVLWGYLSFYPPLFPHLFPSYPLNIHLGIHFYYYMLQFIISFLFYFILLYSGASHIYFHTLFQVYFPLFFFSHIILTYFNILSHDSHL
jgi:hypothetical protein